MVVVFVAKLEKVRFVLKRSEEDRMGPWVSSRESVEMHVTFTDVAAPCRTPVTLPGLRYNLISPWGRPKNLAKKFPNLLNLASHHPLSL